MAIGIAGLGALAGGFAEGLSEGERLRLMREQTGNMRRQGELLDQAIQENNNKLGMHRELSGIRPENYTTPAQDFALQGRAPAYEGMTGGLDQQDVPMRSEGLSVRTPGGIDRERMYGDMAGVAYRHGQFGPGMQLENMRDNVRYQETLRNSRQALAMLGTGNVAGAAKLVQDSFNKIPNGVLAHAEATPEGNVSVRFFDQSTGKQMQNKLMTPDEVRQGVLMMTDPKAYQEMVSKGLERQKDIYVAQLNNFKDLYPRDKWHYGNYGDERQPVMYSDSGSVLFPNALGGTAGVERMRMDKQYRFAIEQIGSEANNVFRTSDLSQLDAPTRALAMDSRFFAQNALNYNWDRADETGQIVRRTPSTLFNLGHGIAQLRNFQPDPKGPPPQEQQVALAKKLGFEPVAGRLIYGREGSPYTYAMFRGREFVVGSRDPAAAAVQQSAVPQQAPQPTASAIPDVRYEGAMNGPVRGVIRRPGQ